VSHELVRASPVIVESGHDHRWIVVQDQRWGMSRPLGGLWKYRWPLSLGRWRRRWQFGRCDTPSEKLLRDCDFPID
jgi:hypothetical protein